MSADRLVDHNAAAHDLVADKYDARHTEIYNPVEQRRIVETIGKLLSMSPAPRPEVLDVGAGTGNLTLKFLAAGCRVCAADVSPRSLERLLAKAGAGASVATKVLEGERLPFADASFDIVATYSVLHHIPDYLLAVREMARVLRPGGLLYIDHEMSENAWSDDPLLREYRSLTQLPLGRHLLGLVASGEAFTASFAKAAFMKAFVNRRYEREGDLHVWHDDHIEWDRVRATLEAAGAPVVHEAAYLLYRPRGGEALYAAYRDRCDDLRLVFARKR